MSAVATAKKYMDKKRKAKPRLRYKEMIKQEYGGNNCKFSAGFVTGHPIDTVYLRLEKDGVEPFILLLRPDEMAAIAWLCSGVLWSHEMKAL